MHGSGNDYVFIDGWEQTVEDRSSLARFLSDRHCGVGGDGLIVLTPSESADAFMDIYNADGSRALMCGNGLRCAAKYLYEANRVHSPRLRIETASGVRDVEVSVEQDRVVAVSIDMGVPVLDPAALGVPLSSPGSFHDVDVEGVTVSLVLVGIGNRHAVLFVDRVEDAPVSSLGPLLEQHVLFPDGINVNFVEVKDKGVLRQRTWERGSGETRACGTGATAGGVAAQLTQGWEGPTSIEMPGGFLQVTWQGPGASATLSGDAVEVFRGRWTST